MNTIWNNERFKQLRETFATDFSARIATSYAPISLIKEKKSNTRTHITPPTMFSFLIKQQRSPAPVSRPFKQSAITSTIQRATNANKLDTQPVKTSKNNTLLHLNTLDSLLNKDAIDIELWNALTGEGSHGVTDPDKNISYVHSDALALITAHQNEFNDGVVFDNLPIGLQLKISPDGAHALCVEETPRASVNPLTVRLTTPEQNLEDQALNDLVDTWFNEQLTSFNKDTVLLSMLRHDPQSPATERVIALLSEFSFTETQCKGVANLLMRTGPQGVLICLQSLQRMKKYPAMYNEFDKTFLQSGDYCQFMSKVGQENLNYFTQLRGSKLTWWNALVTQHQAAGGRVDFNDLFGAYRYFLTELENMGLNNLPSNCPFKSIKHMKVSLERALYIIKHVSPADRLFQLMALDGLDFGPTSAYFAMRFDKFKWVSKDMCLIPQDSNITPLSYSVNASLYYNQVIENPNLSIADSDLLFYRYLGMQKPGSSREIYDGLKEQIISSKVVAAPEQAKLLYMLLMTTFGEEPDRDVALFLKTLQNINVSMGISTTDIITTMFHGFKEISADKTTLTQLTQIMTALAGLTYTSPETILTYLPKMLSLLHTNDELLTIILKRHTAHMANQNESKRFLVLINLLTGNLQWMEENTAKDEQFIKVLTLLSDELTHNGITELSTTLNGISQSHRADILSLLSAINVDKSTNLALFTLAKLNQTVKKLATSAVVSTDEICATITAECPGIKIGEIDDGPSTFTIVDCTKEYLKEHSPIDGIKSIPMLAYLATEVEDLINATLSLSGDELYVLLNKIESRLQGIVNSIGLFAPISLIEGMMKTEEEKVLVREYMKTASMKVYIPLVFLNRFKKALSRSVKNLQTGQQALDDFLITALERVPIKDSDRFGTAIQRYNTQFEAVKSLTNTLLQIKTRNNTDYNQCVAMLNDPNTWAHLGLNNMASLLQGLGDPVSAQLKRVLSTLSSITSTPTDVQIQAAIKDLSLLSQSKDDLGDEAYQMLLEQTLKHDLSQTTSFPLAALIGFKQGSMAEVDKHHADALFKSVLRIIKISPADNSEVLISLIDKTTRLISNHAKDMPNIVSFITIELDAIATASDHRDLLKAGSVCNQGELDWWFLLTMFSTIMSAITLLWVMVCAYWNPPTVAPAETEKTSDALKDYTASLDIIEMGFARHHELLPEIAELFTFWPYPTVNEFKRFFTEENHADALSALETQKQDVSAQIQTTTQTLSEVRVRLAESLDRLEAYKSLVASDSQTHTELLRALVTVAKQAVSHSELEYKALQAESTLLEMECERLKGVVTQLDKSYEYALKQSIKHLDASIKSFDQDPLKMRTKAQTLQHQRTTERAEDVIRNMTHLLKNESFSTADQHELMRQFIYLNVVGTDPSYPLVIGDKRCENLATASRCELRILSKTLIAALRENPNLTPLEDETLTLQLLAVLRESYYRSTGIFPYSTQMLSVLVSLNIPGNLMLQINTGEGKSTTTAILAGLQCALGGMLNERQNKPRTQLVCTGNSTLVEQGYTESHHFFNDFLGLSTSVINQAETDKSTGNSLSNRLALGGITYTTVQALSFYKQRAKREGKSFTQDEEGNSIGMDCTFDECDSAFLDDYTKLSLVAPMDNSDSTTANPNAWIFPLVNQFVGDVTQVGLLRDFIENHPSTNTSQRLQLLSIPDSKLEQWEDAAIDVMDYHEGLDFVILDEEKRTVNEIERIASLVTPVNRSGAPQRGSSFPNYRQEMLQAAMQQRAPHKYFPIDPELEVVDQESVKSLIDSLAIQGRMIGLSGTLGSVDELKELESTFDLHAVKVPPHQKNRRDTSTPILLNKTLQKQNKDLQIIIDKGKNQPLLVVCKTILDVEALHHKLIKRYPGRVQKITGKESALDITQYKDRAGISGMITIGTPLMGRGVDFKTTHPQGFHLHQRFIDAQRETEQIMGRVARNGQLGKYSASYVISGVPFQYGFSYFGVDEAVALKQIKEQQKKITQESSAVRHYIQIFDMIQQVTLQQFDICKQQILETTLVKSESIERSLSTLRSSLIDKLDAAWKSALPKGKNPNPYLNDKRSLNIALKKFEQDTLPALWKETYDALLAMDPNSDGSRLIYLADIKQALNAQKLIEKGTKKQRVMHLKQSHKQLQSALDPAAAMLFYSSDTLSEAETMCLRSSSDKTQLSYMVKQINSVIRVPKIELVEHKTAVENLAEVINHIAKSFDVLSIEQQYRLHATVTQVVEYCKKPEYSSCLDMLDTPIDALEKQVTQSLRNVLASELENRLIWAKPAKRAMDYWFERTNVRSAAEELYNLAANLRMPATQESLSNLYQHLYTYKLLFKNELTNYVPWGHEDIRVVIDDALRHINELKRIELVDESSFLNARNEALYSVYFKRFNNQVEKISRSYPLNKQWKAIADKIKLISKQHSLSVLHDLKHYLSQNAAVEIIPSNKQNYFFGSDKDFPVQDLLKGLEADECKIQQEVPEFSTDKNYLEIKASIITDLLNERGMGTIKSLTITPKYSGIGEYFELRIEGAEHPESFDNDDVVRYTSNLAQLKADKLRLTVLSSKQNQIINDHYDVLMKLTTLDPTNIQLITSNLSEHEEAITALNATLESWLAEKEATPLSYLRSYFDQYPFSDEVIQQIDALLVCIKQKAIDATQHRENLSKEIHFLTSKIAENRQIDETVIIKRFQSIEELLTYEDMLIEHVRNKDNILSAKGG